MDSDEARWLDQDVRHLSERVDDLADDLKRAVRRIDELEEDLLLARERTVVALSRVERLERAVEQLLINDALRGVGEIPFG